MTLHTDNGVAITDNTHESNAHISQEHPGRYLHILVIYLRL